MVEFTEGDARPVLLLTDELTEGETPESGAESLVLSLLHNNVNKKA